MAIRSQCDSLCDACLLAFTRARMHTCTRARARARIPPRVRVLRDTHFTRWHSAPFVYTCTNSYIVRPRDIRLVCATSKCDMCKHRRLGRICERCGYNVPNAIQHRSLHPVHRYGSITYTCSQMISHIWTGLIFVRGTRNNFKNDASPVFYWLFNLNLIKLRKWMPKLLIYMHVMNKYLLLFSKLLFKNFKSFYFLM